MNKNSRLIDSAGFSSRATRAFFVALALAGVTNAYNNTEVLNTLANRIVFENEGRVYSINYDGSGQTEILLEGYDHPLEVTGKVSVSFNGTEIYFVGREMRGGAYSGHCVYRCGIDGRDIVDDRNVSCEFGVMLDFCLRPYEPDIIISYWGPSRGAPGPGTCNTFLIDLGKRTIIRRFEYREVSGFAGEKLYFEYLFPRFIPNSDKFIFSGGSEGRLYMTNLDADYTSVIYENRNLDIRQADLSYDGTKIVFAAYEKKSHDVNTQEILLLDLKNLSVKRLTHNDFQDSAPVFSPDCSKIAFMSAREDIYEGVINEINIMNVDGSDPIKVAEGKYPSFTPIAIDGVAIDSWGEFDPTFLNNSRKDRSNIEAPSGIEEVIPERVKSNNGGTYIDKLKKQLEGARKTKCTTCDGEGFIYVDGNKVDCWCCGGKGYIQIIE